MFLFRLTLTQIDGKFPGYRKNVWSKVIWIITFYWWYLVLSGGGEESLSLYTYKPWQHGRLSGCFPFFFFFAAFIDASEKLRHLEMENSPVSAPHPNVDVNINSQVFWVLFRMPVIWPQTSQESFPSKANIFSFLSLGNLSVLNS